MSNAAKWLAGVILALAFFIGLAFLVPAIKLKVLKMYGTEFESVKTDIYRENKSYVEGTIRDLRELQTDFLKAPEEHKWFALFVEPDSQVSANNSSDVEHVSTQILIVMKPEQSVTKMFLGRVFWHR